MPVILYSVCNRFFLSLVLVSVNRSSRDSFQWWKHTTTKDWSRTVWLEDILRKYQKPFELHNNGDQYVYEHDDNRGLLIMSDNFLHLHFGVCFLAVFFFLSVFLVTQSPEK